MLEILKRRLARQQQVQPIPAGTDIGAPAAAAEPAAAAGVPTATAVEVQDWTRLRAPVSNKDLCLSPLARAWVEGRPPGATPQALVQTYPRITNRLALCWEDPTLALRVLDGLLVDKRGGRRGFPLTVDVELRVLQLEAKELASLPAKKRKALRKPVQPTPGLDHLELVGEPIELDDDDNGVQWV